MDLEALIAQVDERGVSDEPLARVAAARDLCHELAVLGDQVVDHFVEAARSSGCSWAQIGSVLGVSRQGAQQRYGGVWRRMPLVARGRRALPPLTRFGPDARRAVVEAQKSARTLGHDKVDTEHLLLGILAAGADTAGATMLAGCGVTIGAVEEEIVSIVGRGTDAPTGHLPFAAGAKKALELSLREALSLGSRRIGTEHLLLALARQRQGVTAEILAQHGVEHDRIVAFVLERRSK
ncbi:MAG TPA: Clp protease N-terminal domain-containing protein [Gaiella sp.]|nr:Clp protease N-terminal domain-containing protein [Gaiella sp.]